jgi:hypothetical protein
MAFSRHWPWRTSIALGPTTNSMDTPGSFERKGDMYRQVVGLTLGRFAILDARGRSPDVRSSRPPIVRPRGRRSLPRLPAVGDCVRRCSGNLPAVLGRRSLGTTLPPSEQFLPGGVDPHRGAPNENRSSFISRSGLRRKGQRRALGLSVLRTRTRPRNDHRTHRPDLMSGVCGSISIRPLPFARQSEPALRSLMRYEHQREYVFASPRTSQRSSGSSLCQSSAARTELDTSYSPHVGQIMPMPSIAVAICSALAIGPEPLDCSLPSRPAFEKSLHRISDRFVEDQSGL